jgi:hypothetical protein
MDPVGNDHLSRSVTELGEPDALFQISRARFFTKLFVGGTLLVVGLVANYIWWFEGPGQVNHLVLLLLLSTPITGSCLLWHMYRQRGLTILIYPTGLLRLRRGEIDSFPWQDVEQVRLKVQQAAKAEIVRDEDGLPVSCWLPAEAPTFKLWKAGLSVLREDGVEAQFTPALTNYTWLAEEIQKRTFSIHWPLIWEKFLAAVPIQFGDLEISLKGVYFGNKHIRWFDVKELSVLQGQLRIKQSGKWLPSINVDVYSIPNPHILFALAREAQRAAAVH